MKLRKPECGNDREAHGAHRYARWSSDTGLASCGGWSEREYDVADMARMVWAAITRNELDHPVGRPALQVEIHPVVRHYLAQMLVPDAVSEMVSMDEGVQMLFGVPLVVSYLEKGGWRVVPVVKPLAEGKVRG